MTTIVLPDGGRGGLSAALARLKADFGVRADYMRWILGTFGVAWGINFLVFRDWWTRFLARTAPPGTPASFPQIFPYVGFAMLDGVVDHHVYGCVWQSVKRRRSTLRRGDEGDPTIHLVPREWFTHL